MLEAQNLHKSFSTHHVLKGISITVHPGEIQVLIGLNGCGKTTLQRVLTGILEPDQGTVMIGGQDITHLSPEDRNVGYVPQHTALFRHLTVRENILYPLQNGRGSEETFHQVVKLLSLEPYLDWKPHKLSGGYRARVALARALVSAPRVMLLDEPITEVDRAKKEFILPLFREVLLQLNVPVLYITHDPWEAAQIGTSFSVMKDGIVHRIDSPEEAFALIREQARRNGE
ncbi:MAG TPA: ABC transporter ATP-binding protein [Methanoregulaceae archaeon]|nr:MAG: ABC transporter ATP-binding protein [Methanolinea sp.]HON80841.1 ABC transporter ATP-binding protein [Methanoregulaceae archaeon]HPD09576.1 ABC transporter ATP-binding protein [Methanoregulaceae archaeon]HRT15247.1 ABC transporter ATP-binding protein [Methanoregulaceae archaeon]HRU30818.1 ABC transporter ATP-binding protein [Methanoregulaceae archaeon]